MKISVFFLAAFCTVIAHEAYAQKCASGDCMKGTGTMIWQNGDKYTGQFRNGTMHGRGTMTYKSGVVYAGSWAGGAISGKGVMSWATGDRYDGYFKNNTMHGTGTMTWKNGDRYQGSYRDGRRSGWGTMTWSKGDKYAGLWSNDQMDGFGTMTYANKTVVRGKWKNGTIAGQQSDQAAPVPNGTYGLFCLLNPFDTQYTEEPSIELVFREGGAGTYRMLTSENQYTGQMTWKLESKTLTINFVGMEDGIKKYIYDGVKKVYHREPEPYGPRQTMVSVCKILKI